MTSDPFGPEEYNPGVNYVGELLAVLHSDGGHYTNAHGVNKAAFDALEKHYALLRRAEAAEHALAQAEGRDRLRRTAEDVIYRATECGLIGPRAYATDLGVSLHALNQALASAEGDRHE